MFLRLIVLAVVEELLLAKAVEQVHLFGPLRNPLRAEERPVKGHLRHTPEGALEPVAPHTRHVNVVDRPALSAALSAARDAAREAATLAAWNRSVSQARERFDADLYTAEATGRITGEDKAAILSLIEPLVARGVKERDMVAVQKAVREGVARVERINAAYKALGPTMQAIELALDDEVSNHRMEESERRERLQRVFHEAQRALEDFSTSTHRFEAEAVLKEEWAWLQHRAKVRRTAPKTFRGKVYAVFVPNANPDKFKRAELAEQIGMRPGELVINEDPDGQGFWAFNPRRAPQEDRLRTAEQWTGPQDVPGFRLVIDQLTDARKQRWLTYQEAVGLFREGAALRTAAPEVQEAGMIALKSRVQDAIFAGVDRLNTARDDAIRARGGRALTEEEDEALMKAVEQMQLYGAGGVHEERRPVRGYVRSAGGKASIIAAHQRGTKVANRSSSSHAPTPATGEPELKRKDAVDAVAQAAASVPTKTSTGAAKSARNQQALDNVATVAEWKTPAPDQHTDQVNDQLIQAARTGAPLPTWAMHPAAGGNVRGDGEYNPRAYLGRVSRDGAPLAALWARTDTGEVLAYPENGATPVSLGDADSFTSWRGERPQIGLELSEAGRTWRLTPPPTPRQARSAALRRAAAASAQPDRTGPLPMSQEQVNRVEALAARGTGFCNHHLRMAFKAEPTGPYFALTSYDEADAVAAGLGECKTLYAGGDAAPDDEEAVERDQAALNIAIASVRGWMDAEELRLRDLTDGRGFDGGTPSNPWTRTVRALATGTEPAVADLTAIRDGKAGAPFQEWSRAEQGAALPGLDYRQIRDVQAKLFRRIKG